MIKLKNNHHFYETHIKRIDCICGSKIIDLFTFQHSKTFIMESSFFFKCGKCGIRSDSHITSNGASANWNNEIKRKIGEKMTHTRGEWFYESCKSTIEPKYIKFLIFTKTPDDYNNGYGINTGGKRIDIASIRVQPSKVTSESNARLISAAPELLEALKYARRFLKPEDIDTNYIDSVIFKAESPTS